MSDADLQAQSEIACNLNVFTPDELEQHAAMANTVFGAALEVCPLPNGYAVRLPGDSPMLMNVATFVREERRCCAFETYEIRVEPHQRAIWLSLIGPDGYREAVAADLTRLLKPDVVAAAGLG